MFIHLNTPVLFPILVPEMLLGSCPFLLYYFNPNIDLLLCNFDT